MDMNGFDQPPPTGEGEIVYDHAERLLLAVMRRQRDKGLAHYGTLLRAHNGRDPLMDALQEQVDAMLYIVQAMIERDDYARKRGDSTPPGVVG
jgi:hypothetical protein